MKIKMVILVAMVFTSLNVFALDAPWLKNNCQETRAGTHCFVSEKIQCHSGESTLKFSYSYYHVYYYPRAPEEFIKNIKASIEAQIAVYGECMTRNCGAKYYQANASTADAAYKVILADVKDDLKKVELIHATNVAQNVSVAFTDRNNEIEIQSLKIGDQELPTYTNFICNKESAN